MHKHSTKLFVVVSIALVAMLVTAGTVFANGPGNPDNNGDGVICVMSLPGGEHVEIDNNLDTANGNKGCPAQFAAKGFKPAPGDETDRNGDGIICVKSLPDKRTVEIDNRLDASNRNKGCPLPYNPLGIGRAVKPN